MLTLTLVLALIMGALLSLDTLVTERRDARLHASSLLVVTPMTWTPKPLHVEMASGTPIPALPTLADAARVRMTIRSAR